jgi:fatty acid desaturase
MRTTLMRFRWNLLNFLFFMPRVSPNILRGNERFKQVLGPRAKPWKDQLILEAAIVWSVKVLCLLLDWRKALLYVIVPHLFANWGIVSVNFLQHDGCDPDHPYNHSRNFVGKWFNWLTLNNGYHGIHHLMPGRHWSLLAKAHAEQVAPHIHPALDQRSLAVYLWTTFIYPGKRLRYDGAPVVIRDEPASRDWVRPTDSPEVAMSVAEEGAAMPG